MIKAVIFDLDDTLIPERDYVISGLTASAAVLSDKDNGVEAVISSLIRLFDQSPSEVFNRYIDEHGLPSSLLGKCLQIYRAHKPNIHLNKEAISILKWLRGYGVLLGLITDGRPEGQRAKIEALHLEDYMNTIIVTDELGGISYRKPNPLAFKMVMERLAVTPNEAIYVGDNPQKDFLAPNSLGMVSVMYTGIQGLHNKKNIIAYGEPQYVIDRLPCLRDIIIKGFVF